MGHRVSAREVRPGEKPPETLEAMFRRIIREELAAHDKALEDLREADAMRERNGW